MKRVIALQHTANGYEGAEVFKQSIQALSKDGYAVDLITANAGVKLQTNAAETHVVERKTSTNPLLNLLNYLSWQLRLLALIAKLTNKGDIIYIDSASALPAALLSKLFYSKIIYHVQNAPVNTGLRQSLIWFMVNRAVNHVIFTSESLKKRVNLSVKKQTVIYNTPSQSFTEQVRFNTLQRVQNEPFNVLMISDFAAHKGIVEFVELARLLPELSFNLVITSGIENVARLSVFKAQPANLYVHTEHANLHPFYEAANVVVNLSQTDNFLESCDAKIIESMCYGLPVIVPSKGGLKELIDPEKHGAAIDSRYLNEIACIITLFSANRAFYQQVSSACLRRARLFSPTRFNAQIVSLFRGHQLVHNILDNVFEHRFSAN